MPASASIAIRSLCEKRVLLAAFHIDDAEDRSPSLTATQSSERASQPLIGL
jgi:hypothetical protein